LNGFTKKRRLEIDVAPNLSYEFESELNEGEKS